MGCLINGTDLIKPLFSDQVDPVWPVGIWN